MKKLIFVMLFFMLMVMGYAQETPVEPAQENPTETATQNTPMEPELIPINNECFTGLNAKYDREKYLLLKIDGIPTMVEHIPGNLGMKTSCTVKINPDATFKVKSFLGEKSDSTNVLSKGDLLLIKEIAFKKDKVVLLVRTDKAMPFNVKGRSTWLGSSKSTGTDFHRTEFVFGYGKNWNCEDIQAILEKYFDLYNTKDEVTQAKEIKMGMSIEEVTKILGEPSKKADMGGGKVLFKYEDTVVTFQDGKIVNIEFK